MKRVKINALQRRIAAEVIYMGKILGLKELHPGMVIAAPVLTSNQQVVLQENIELTSHLINLLHRWNIKSICVKAERHRKIAEFTRNPSSVNFNEPYKQAVQEAKKTFEYMRKKEKVPYFDFYKLAYGSLYELTCKKNALASLYYLKAPVDYIYLHAVDVGIIAGLIGRWCGLEHRDIKKLILAGLMHDIGKSQIPISILEKPGLPTLEEMDVLKLHPTYGYYMVKSIPGIDLEVQQAILQHHERENGCGYPGGSSASGIHSFAKILAIADVYDAMISNRVYKNSVTPFAALDTLANQIVTHFDRKYCEIFIRNSMKTLIDATVLLSDHSLAKVVGFNGFLSVNPTVQKNDGQLIDLNEPGTSSIVEIVNFP